VAEPARTPATGSRDIVTDPPPLKLAAHRRSAGPPKNPAGLDGSAAANHPAPAGPRVRSVPGSDLRITTSVPPYRRAEILGLPVANCTLEDLVGTVEAWVDQRITRTAAGVNANVVNLAARDPKVGDLFRANDLNYLDGQSMVWASRMLGLPAVERVATTDVALPLARMCARRDFGLYLLGGRPEVVEAAAARLVEQVPGLRVHHRDGFFGPEQEPEIIREIADTGAQVVLVGLGDPLQQHWVQAHRDQIQAVMLTCGGLFDWISGNNRRPPQWMVTAGLEWLWRVWLEPRRLARRYLVGNPEFLLRLARARLRR